MRKGIDISYCQRGFSLEKAKKEGVEFVIIRAGIATHKDTEFKTHTDSAEKIGLPYGFYWYSDAFSVAAAKSEAKTCIETIKAYDPSYPIFYDMEEKSQIDKLTTKERTDIIVTFCEEVKKAGYTVGVYLNPSWFENYIEKNRIVGKYEVWLAHWTENPNIPSKYNYGQVMWQWGLDKINGVGVDGDVCFKDYPIKAKNPVNNGNKDDTTTASLKKGDEIRLTNAALYGASTSTVKANTVTGTYYIHSDGVTNNRIRITTSKGNVACTGWVDIADCNKANETPTPTKPATPTISTESSSSLKKGDKVKLTGAALYSASTSTAKANTVTGTYYIYTYGIINNRIRITTSKGNPACTGWVNVSDCNAVTVPASETVSLKKGNAVRLKGAALYGASTSPVKANTITGTYHIYSDGVINNRIRITTSKNNTVCTGWVNVSDCKA